MYSFHQKRIRHYQGRIPHIQRKVFEILQADSPWKFFRCMVLIKSPSSWPLNQGGEKSLEAGLTSSQETCSEDFLSEIKCSLPSLGHAFILSFPYWDIEVLAFFSPLYECTKVVIFYSFLHLLQFRQGHQGQRDCQLSFWGLPGFISSANFDFMSLFLSRKILPLRFTT